MRKQVRILQLSSDDEAEFVNAARASRTLHQKWVSPPTTRKSFREKLKQMQGRANLAYSICRADNDPLVGCIEITQIFRGPFRSAYLGYYALTLERNRFLRPCYWEVPMPDAPEELAHLHFASLELASRGN